MRRTRAISSIKAAFKEFEDFPESRRLSQLDLIKDRLKRLREVFR